MNKYSTCPSCGGLMEYLYSIDRTDIKYCAACGWEWRHIQTHELVGPDEKMAERYGE
tara:strand:+ start:588 stop:758 length:171 start_codon:yes stop_codon:yes gene_type:complete